MQGFLERVVGVEPTLLTWKDRVIAVIRHPLTYCCIVAATKGIEPLLVPWNGEVTLITASHFT